jgi:hypothetical protein
MLCNMIAMQNALRNIGVLQLQELVIRTSSARVGHGCGSGGRGRCERKRMGGDPYQCFLLLPSDRPASSAVPPHAPASAAARPCSSAHTHSSALCLTVAARTSGGDGAAAQHERGDGGSCARGRGSIAFVRAWRLCGDGDKDSGFLFYWTHRGLRLPFARPGERRS